MCEMRSRRKADARAEAILSEGRAITDADLLEALRLWRFTRGSAEPFRVDAERGMRNHSVFQKGAWPSSKLYIY